MRHEQAISLIWQMARWYRDGKKLAAAPPMAQAEMDKALVVVSDLILEVQNAEKDTKLKANLAIDVMREACPNLYPYMEVSTANITEKTAAWLADPEQHQGPKPVLIQNEYGWFVYVIHKPDAGEEDGWPQDLRAVIQYARDRNCNWVQLDQDADPVHELPTYDW